MKKPKIVVTDNRAEWQAKTALSNEPTDRIQPQNRTECVQ
jgi:hypothetical protein